MSHLLLKSLPDKLYWENVPLKWDITDNDTITFTAGKQTDLFNDPSGTFSINNSPRLLFTPQINFTLSAKIQVQFGCTYDAGALLIYNDNKFWAKLCFELADLHYPSIVSVVNSNFSDDCNSMRIDDEEVYLRIAKSNQAFAFHYSNNGTSWHLIRYFTLGKISSIKIGFSVQSPKGNSCTATFSDIIYSERMPEDIRNSK